MKHTIPQRLIEHAFVFDVLADYGPEKVLDVGTGTRSTLPATLLEAQVEVVAIDEMVSYWGHAVENRYSPIIPADILSPNKCIKNSAPFDAVTCICTLEHIIGHDRAVKNMVDLLKVGGVLILTFPYASEYELDIYNKLGRPKQYPVQLFSGVEVAIWCNQNPVELKRIEFSKHFEGETWGVGGRLLKPRRHRTESESDFCCLALEKEAS